MKEGGGKEEERVKERALGRLLCHTLALDTPLWIVPHKALSLSLSLSFSLSLSLSLYIEVDP